MSFWVKVPEATKQAFSNRCYLTDEDCIILDPFMPIRNIAALIIINIACQKKTTTRVDAWVQPLVSLNSFVTAAEHNPSQLILFSVTVVMQVCGFSGKTSIQTEFSG